MDNELQSIVDGLAGLVWSASPDGDVASLNRYWSDYTGLGRDTLKGDGWHAALHPDDRADAVAAWHAVVASRRSGEFEARVHGSDDRYRWFLFRVAPSTDASGRVVRWHGLGTDIEDHRRNEEGLRYCKDQLQLIVDHIPALITFMTPEGKLQFVNRKVVEYFGATPEELKAKAIGETIHADDRVAAMAAWWRSVATGQPFEVEVRRRRRDGVYRWFVIRGDPLRDKHGAIVVWYLLHTDIDDRRRADHVLSGEKRLLETVASGRPLQDVLDSLCTLAEEIVGECHGSVLVVDPLGTTLRLGAAPSLPSPHIESQAGMPIDDAAGPAGLAASTRRQLLVPDASHETRWDAHGWRHAMRAHRLESCWATPILSRAGQVLGTFALYRRSTGGPDAAQLDVLERLTHIASIAIERSRNDAAQQRNEAFLVRAQELSATGSYWWHVPSGELRWSEQLYRIYGYPQGTHITNDLVRARFHPEDVPLFHSMIDQAQGPGRDFEYEHRLLMPDGSVKHVHVVAHGTLDADGALEFIGAVQDVTERRLADEAIGKARSELTHVARATSLGVLTASIAHEVNQPLAGIITNAGTCLRLLAAEPPNLEGARETARRTIRDGNRAADVIVRLRALFAKKESTAESLDLNDAVREVIALSRSELQRHGVVVQTRLATDLPTVVGDRVQLQQVILNLLLNASDAMRTVDDRPRSLLIVTREDESDRVRVTVRDVGVGIDPQATQRLFDPFYTTKSDGMGIGLSVSRSIIERHRGRMWAMANEGHGATFGFSIPCRVSNDERGDAGRVRITVPPNHECIESRTL